MTWKRSQYYWNASFEKCYFLSKQLLIMVTDQLYRRKILCGCFCFTWLWLLIAIMKRCTEWYALQFYSTSIGVLVKTFHSDKINVTKMNLFHARAPTHHSFTFNFRFLYELKRKVYLSKSVRGIFHFRFRLVFC